MFAIALRAHAGVCVSSTRRHCRTRRMLGFSSAASCTCCTWAARMSLPLMFKYRMDGRFTKFTSGSGSMMLFWAKFTRCVAQMHQFVSTRGRGVATARWGHTSKFGQLLARCSTVVMSLLLRSSTRNDGKLKIPARCFKSLSAAFR